MRITWTCKICGRKETTSHNAIHVSHLHGKEEIDLIPYKKAMKERGVDTVASLKAEVWKLFSEYVRRTESDEHGYCVCVTCGKRDHYKNMQAGHFIHGTLFRIPELVHVQCPQCNGFKAGMAIEYKEYMIKKYSEDGLARIEFLAKRAHIFTIFELQQYKKLYLDKLENLR
jgi:hypothetical protein